MTHGLDQRTRRNSDLRTIDATAFFADEFPDHVERHGELVIEAAERLGAPPLAIEVDGRAWTISATGGRLIAEERLIDGAPTITLTAEQFSDWAQDHRSLNAFHVGMELPLRDGGELEVSLWDGLWRCLLDGWPVVGDLEFLDRSGAPLDLGRVFTPDDDPADIAHHLREAGFLHLRGWIDRAAVAQVSTEIDDARAAYAEGTGARGGPSWTTALESSSGCSASSSTHRRPG